jgi:hypothetical protein
VTLPSRVPSRCGSGYLEICTSLTLPSTATLMRRAAPLSQSGSTDAGSRATTAPTGASPSTAESWPNSRHYWRASGARSISRNCLASRPGKRAPCKRRKRVEELPHHRPLATPIASPHALDYQETVGSSSGCGYPGYISPESLGHSGCASASR